MTDLLPGISLRHVDTARVRTGVLVDDRTEGEAVVLVHGNVSSSIFWQETMLALPAGFRAFAPDLLASARRRPHRSTRPAAWATSPTTSSRCSTRSASRRRTSSAGRWAAVW